MQSDSPQATSPAALFSFSLGTLVVTVAVILWGAVVRATKFGDGCGAHWPYCNGQWIPRAAATPTIVEYTHRITSGFAMLLVYLLTIWVYRSRLQGHPARKAAKWASIFMTGESLIGALLVLFRLVASEESTKRAVSGGLHLINTFLLVASLVSVSYFLRREYYETNVNKGQKIFGLMMVFFLFLGATGAIAALGDTLFPARTLASGFYQDFSPVAHLFIRLRAIHPFAAVFGILISWVCLNIWLKVIPSVEKEINLIKFVFVFQLLIGTLNLWYLAPLFLQIFHLLIANVLWILFCYTVLRSRWAPLVEERRPSALESV